MTVLNRLAHFQNRRDEEPNLILAKALAETRDTAGIREIAQNLWNENADVQSDCVKVLYEVGAIEPRLIAGYSDDFLKLLGSKNNRLVWGGMTALAAVAEVSAAELFKSWQTIRDAVETGSVTLAPALQVQVSPPTTASRRWPSSPRQTRPGARPSFPTC